MYIVKLKSKTQSQYLLKLGVPKWIEINCREFSTLEDAAKYCKKCNQHTMKFHPEQIGNNIHYIKEINK